MPCGTFQYMNMASGNLKVSNMALSSGEDQANDVTKVEQRFSGTYCTSDTQVKSAAGFLHCISIACTDSAPTAGSIIIYDNTAESGTVIQTINITTTFFNPIQIMFNRTCTTGIYVGFTTTADVNVHVSYR